MWIAAESHCPCGELRLESHWNGWWSSLGKRCVHYFQIPFWQPLSQSRSTAADLGSSQWLTCSSQIYSEKIKFALSCKFQFKVCSGPRKFKSRFLFHLWRNIRIHTLALKSLGLWAMVQPYASALPQAWLICGAKWTFYTSCHEDPLYSLLSRPIIIIRRRRRLLFIMNLIYHALAGLRVWFSCRAPPTLGTKQCRIILCYSKVRSDAEACRKEYVRSRATGGPPKCTLHARRRPRTEPVNRQGDSNASSLHRSSSTNRYYVMHIRWGCMYTHAYT